MDKKLDKARIINIVKYSIAILLCIWVFIMPVFTVWKISTIGITILKKTGYGALTGSTSGMIDGLYEMSSETGTLGIPNIAIMIVVIAALAAAAVGLILALVSLIKKPLKKTVTACTIIQFAIVLTYMIFGIVSVVMLKSDMKNSAGTGTEALLALINIQTGAITAFIIAALIFAAYLILPVIMNKLIKDNAGQSSQLDSENNIAVDSENNIAVDSENSITEN